MACSPRSRWSTTARWATCACCWSARFHAGSCWLANCWRAPWCRSRRSTPIWSSPGLWGIEAPVWGYVTVLPALALSGMMLGALGMLLSSVIRQLENFAGVMNFVIFPMFFASSALYPLWLVQQSSPVVYTICRLNPFTYAVELIRFALYCKIDWTSLAVVAVMTIVFTDRRDHRLRPCARPDRASRRRRRMTSRRILAAGLALGAMRLGAARRHRRAARSGLAVPADQGAAAFSGGSLVRSSARCTPG